ncbi:MgtC/SapB family protein, partial [bacterium]
MFDTIVQAMRQEFADLKDAGEFARVVVRLLVAAVLGGALGYQREAQGKAAGLRTHILVAMGSAMFVMVPQQMGADDDSIARVLQGLVAGIGFLGTGAIVKGMRTPTDKSGEVTGLTTAAGIW